MLEEKKDSLTPVPLPPQPLTLSKADQDFQAELFGFNRDKVLEAIDRLTQDNEARTKELDSALTQMQQRVQQAELEKAELERTLKTQRDMRQDAEQTVQQRNDASFVALRTQLEEMTQALDECRTRIENKEQELLALRTENVRLNSMVHSLTTSLANAKGDHTAEAEAQLMARLREMEQQRTSEQQAIQSERLQQQRMTQELERVNAEQAARNRELEQLHNAETAAIQQHMGAQQAAIETARLSRIQAEQQAHQMHEASGMIAQATRQAQSITQQAQEHAAELRRRAEAEAQQLQQQAKQAAEKIQLQAVENVGMLTRQAAQHTQTMENRARQLAAQSAQSVAQSVQALKEQLAETDYKIHAANEALQKANTCIALALQGSDAEIARLTAMGVLQAKEPTPMPEDVFAQNPYTQLRAAQAQSISQNAPAAPLNSLSRWEMPPVPYPGMQPRMETAPLPVSSRENSTADAALLQPGRTALYVTPSLQKRSAQGYPVAQEKQSSCETVSSEETAAMPQPKP